MNMERDPELDDLLVEPGLAEFAQALRASAASPEPPLDSAFRSALRRQLMQKAWEMGEGRVRWWQRLASPPGLAWAGAAVGTILIASVVVYTNTQGPGGNTQQVILTSSVADARAVQLAQPIPLAFNQPMDHATTEAAVQVQPATQVSYTWQGNTLYVQPTGGNLAPNTQYQVTVGSGAKTAGGQTLAAPQTVRFVTQPAPSPAPTPLPTPTTLLTNLHEVAPAQGGQPMWSADGATIYRIAADGSLVAIDSASGNIKTLVAGGVVSAALSPAGDRLAYTQPGAVDILTLASSATATIALKTNPVLVAWESQKTGDRVIWATQNGIFDAGDSGPEQVALLPDATSGSVQSSGDTVISIAPDGTHLVYTHENQLLVFDIAGGRTAPVGPTGVPQFYGWSPDGARLMYQGSAQSVVIASTDGRTVVTLPSGTPSWSAQNEILLGSDTELYVVNPDRSGLLKLADGSFNSPVWAPDSINFSFERGGSLWAAQAPAPIAPPNPLDQATQVVNAYMQARLNGSADKAAAFLDDAGKAAYQKAGGPALIIGGDPAFSRFYILTSELVTPDANSARFVVRLVLSKDKVDVSQFDETLTVTRSESTDPFLVDSATVGEKRDLGKGPEVVSVDIAPDQVRVTFDSDLNPTTVPVSVMIRDARGKPLTGGITTYANHVVTIAGLQLVPGENYSLTVLPTLGDVGGRSATSEYDLAIIGPIDARAATQTDSHGRPNTIATPSPAP